MRSHTRTRSPLRSATKQRHRRASASRCSRVCSMRYPRPRKQSGAGCSARVGCVDVAQHPHAAVGGEAADVPRKTLGKALLDGGQCQWAQRVALPDARPLVRRRGARGIGMAAAGQRPQRAGEQHEHHPARPLLGECLLSRCKTQPTHGGHSRAVEPAPTPPRTPQPAPRDRSPRARPLPAPADATRKQPARCCAPRCRATPWRPPAARGARRHGRPLRRPPRTTHAVK